MPDTEALRELESADTAFLFVVGGVGAWTNVPELASQADYFGDGRPVWVGLTPPSYELGIDVLDSRIDDFRMTVELQDQRDIAGGGYLAALFRAWHESEEPLDLTVEAGDTNLGNASLFDRHVGTERIGPAGQRAYWSAFPGWSIGDQHLGADYENADLAAALVSEVPIVYRGRRCSLWRVYRDRVTYPNDRSQGWQPWSESVRLWWGELEDGGTVDGSRWSLECRGPDSYLGGQLGTLSRDEGVSVRRPISLTDPERRVALFLRSYQASDPSTNRRTYGGSTDFSEVLPASFDDPSGLISAISTIVSSAASAAGPDGAFNDFDGQRVRFSDDGVAIRIDNEAGGVLGARVPVLELCMHETVWRSCGYDPVIQHRQVNPAGLPVEGLPWSTDLDQAGDGFPPGSSLWTEPTEPPGPRFFALKFSTAGHMVDDENIQPGSYDNQGTERLYPPLYPGGLSVLPSALNGGTVIRLSPAGGGIVRHTGQLDRPPTDIGPGELVQGLLLLEGPRSTAIGEVEDETQVVVGTWVEGTFPGSIGAGVDADVTLTRWLDPRRFGIDRDSIPESGFDWAIVQNDPENLVRARPIFRLGHSEHGFDDRAEDEILRLMLTTGASTGWSGFEGDPGATLDQTANEPDGPGSFDAEVRDLGLAIPGQLVAPIADWRSEFAKLPAGAYRRLGMLVTPGVSASEVIEQWLRFYGMVPSLHGAQYGVVTLLDRFEPEDVEVTLTQASKAPEEHRVSQTTQRLRVYRPVDTFEVSFRYDPAAAEFTRKEEIRANDRGVRYRSDGVPYKMGPKGIRSLDGWRSRRTAIARFWEKRHLSVQGWPVLSRLVGERIFPGTIVRLTEPRGVSQDGTYSIDGQIGIVTRKRENCATKNLEVDILVQADSSRPFSVMAPSVLGYGFDTDTNEVLVFDDWQGLGGDWSDASRLLEPDWSDAGGMLDVKGMQWDGQTMIEAWTQTVAGVTTTPGSSRVQLSGPPVGTYYRDMPCWIVPREHENQTAAWALQHIAVIGDESGLFGGGAVASSKWSD
ncbi:MAG: hypothetical protein ACRBN8_22405 [Nannocystales bacterium]